MVPNVITIIISAPHFVITHQKKYINWICSIFMINRSCICNKQQTQTPDDYFSCNGIPKKYIYFHNSEYFVQA